MTYIFLLYVAIVLIVFVSSVYTTKKTKKLISVLDVLRLLFDSLMYPLIAIGATLVVCLAGIWAIFLEAMDWLDTKIISRKKD